MASTFANIDLSNVGPYQTAATPIPNPAPSNPLSPINIPAGLGDRYILRHSYCPRMDASTSPNQAGVISVDGVTAFAGGRALNSVPEARSDLLIYDTPSTNLSNPNVTAVQGRLILTSDGTGAGGNVITFFAGSDYLSTTSAADNFNLCGREADVGSPNTNAICFGRSAFSAVSIGSLRANVYPGSGSITGINDAGVVVTSGPQVGGVSNPGWGSALQVSSGYDTVSMSYLSPIIPAGSIIRTAGAWTCSIGIDLRSASFDDSILSTSSVSLRQNSATFIAPNFGIEVGALGAVNTPYIDFHSGPAVRDYDTRILSSNGSPSVDGGGEMYFYAAALRPVCSIVPTNDNLNILGQPANRYKTAYFGTAPVVGSDERIKDDVQELPFDGWIEFLRLLKPISFRFKAIVSGEKTEVRKTRRVVTKSIEIEEMIESIVDGRRVVKKILTVKQVPATERVPIYNEDGSPVLIPTSRAGVNSEPTLGHPSYQAYMEWPLYEDIDEEFQVRASQTTTGVRTHVGFTAQGVKRALEVSKLDNNPDLECSIWGMFIYDKDSDLFMLRYEEFIAPLVLGWKNLDERLRKLEGA